MKQQEYEKWQRVFYTGNLIAKGWTARQKELLALIADKHAEVQTAMEAMGALIAPEWARANNIRKINNQDLMRWGERLKKAARISGTVLLTEIQGIQAEIEQTVKEPDEPTT